MSALQTRRPQDEVMEIIYSIQKTSRFSTWSPALRAAPNAIYVMAVCLRAASDPEAKAISVEPSFQGRHGNQVQFPSPFLDTNLQHCSDLGRRAFRAAESGMRKLQLNLESILGPYGTLRSLVGLLDRPRDAKYQLRDAMDKLQASAEDCKREATAMRDQFDRMLEFTTALNKATMNRQGVTSLEQDENEKKTREERASVARYQGELDVAGGQRAKAIEARDQALEAVRAAEMKVTQGTKSSISMEEIRKLVVEAHPDLNHEKNYGWIPGGIHRLFGRPRDRVREEREGEKALAEAREAYTKELLRIRQEGADASQRRALQALEEARRVAADCQAELDRASERYRRASEKLLTSSNSLEEASLMLAQLGAEKLDLKQTQKILKTSMESLTTFKHQIDGMLAYFTENAEYVEKLAAPNGQLGKILSTIEAVSRASGGQNGARVMANLQFDPEDKEAVMAHAVQLEGRFSFVYEIAGVYLDVSRRYIIPGINQMEELALVTDGDRYNAKVREFEQFVRDAKVQIEAMSSSSREGAINTKVGENMWIIARTIKMAPDVPFPQTAVIEEAQDEEDEQYYSS